MSGTTEALESLTEAVRYVAPTGAISTWRLDPSAVQLTLACAQGISLTASACLVADSPLGQQALASGSATLAVSDPAASADPLLALHLSQGVQGGATVLALRIGSNERPQGLLLIHTVAPQEKATLQALCQLSAVALSAAQRTSELTRVEASRNQFIHVTTHELRSPLAVSQTLIRNVVKGYAGPLTDKQKDVFTRISGQLDRLEGLVNDLLDLAASRAIGAEALEPVMLNAAIGRAVLLLGPNAEERGVELLLRPCREELVVRATEDGLDRIFVNLVGNAVKYTPAGGRVTVSFARSADQVTVAVADTGLGIPAEALAHLFEEFYRAPNVRAANITGTGLGLVIVKELVEQFRGHIDVKSEEGKGSTFTVFFPLYR